MTHYHRSMEENMHARGDTAYTDRHCN